MFYDRDIGRWEIHSLVSWWYSHHQLGPYWWWKIWGIQWFRFFGFGVVIAESFWFLRSKFWNLALLRVKEWFFGQVVWNIKCQMEYFRWRYLLVNSPQTSFSAFFGQKTDILSKTGKPGNPNLFHYEVKKWLLESFEGLPKVWGCVLWRKKSLEWFYQAR